MLVESAVFREATKEEISRSKGGYLWNLAALPWNTMNKVVSLWGIYQSGADILKWQTPLPMRFMHAFTRYMGWAPERFFIDDIPTFFGNIHIIKAEEVVARAFFAQHRNGKLFSYSRSFQKILDLIQRAFPDTSFTEDDCMLTCSPEKTSQYRACLNALLNGQDMQDVVDNVIQSTLASWIKKCKGEKFINATIESRLFASRVITRLLFGEESDNKELAREVTFINSYITKVFARQVAEGDEEKLEHALEIFRNAVQAVLKREQEGEIPLFSNRGFNSAQKKAMIFIIYFAGQETVASLLTYMLWELGKNLEMQAALTADKVHDFFISAIHDFTPAYGVSRTLKVPVCLEFRLTGEEHPRKIIMYKGESLAVQMLKMAETVELNENSEKRQKYRNWMPFGSGPHKCPGEALANREIKKFLEKIFTNYTVRVQNDANVSKVGHVTLHLSNDIYFNIDRGKDLAKTN